MSDPLRITPSGDLAAFSGTPRGEYDPRTDPSMRQMACRICGELAECWINPQLVPPAAGASATCAACSGRPHLSIDLPHHCPEWSEVEARALFAILHALQPLDLSARMRVLRAISSGVRLG